MDPVIAVRQGGRVAWFLPGRGAECTQGGPVGGAYISGLRRGDESHGVADLIDKVSSYDMLSQTFFFLKNERTGEIWHTSPLARTQHCSITCIWEAQS